MSDWFPGKIEIGGDIPAELADELHEMVAYARAALDWGGDAFRPASVGDLVAAVDPETGHLRLFDDQACYGRFEALEDWLEENGISYDRHSDAYGECEAEVVSFRAATGVVARLATQCGDPLVERAPVDGARDVLRAAIDARSPELVRQALEALESALGPEVPPLPRLRFIPVPQ